MPVSQRLRHVRTLRHLLVTRCDELCAAVTCDLGKAAEETIGGDILPLADACLFLERNAAQLLRPRKVPRRFGPTFTYSQCTIR